MCVYVWYEHYMHTDESRRGAWAIVDRGTSTGNLSPGCRSGGLGPLGNGPKIGGLEPCQARPYGSFGHGARLPEAVLFARPKEAGTQGGSQGRTGAAPERIDEHREHRLPCCPHCHGALKQCDQTRTRYIEDIPTGITPVVTEHTIHRDWCPHCKKLVEPVVPDALPKATLGNRTLVMTGWLHYGLGNTLSQIIDVFNYHLQLKLTPGGLVQMWGRLQEVLFPWYEQIQQEAQGQRTLCVVLAI